MKNVDIFLKDHLKEIKKRYLIEKIQDIKETLKNYPGEDREFKQDYINLVNRLCDLEIKLEEIENDNLH